MARMAKKDTYGLEDVGGGVDVRRRVVAGQRVPDHYDVPDADVEETEVSFAPRTYDEGQITKRVGADGRLRANRKKTEVDPEAGTVVTKGSGGSKS